MNEENLKRLRKSHIIYLDFTFHHPKDFEELLIIMYEDVITNLKIPGNYSFINGKYQNFYDKLYESIMNLITDNNNIKIISLYARPINKLT